MALSKQKKLKMKKQWFTVLSSPEFNEQPIGETMAFESESLVGRTLKVGLSTVMKDLKRQGKTVTFKIKEVKGATAHTEFISYNIMPMNLRRLVRKEKDKVDDSFVIETKDGVKAKVKPLFVTKGKTQRSVQTALRMQTREFFAHECKEKPYSELVLGLISGNIQKELKLFLKKVYPLAIVEIRVMQKI